MKAKKKANPTRQSTAKRSVSAHSEGTASTDPVDESEKYDMDSATSAETPQERRCLRISQSDGCFLKFLNKDRQACPSFCDVAITVRGKTYHAHKVVLAFGSSHFHAKLSENPALDHVTFDNVESSIFGHLLDFLYTSEMEVQESQIPSLAEAACFFDMMEAVNLLAGELEAAPGRQEGGEEGEEEEPETSPPEGGVQKPQAETRCSFCGRTFRYKKLLDNHVAKMHSSSSTKAVEETVIKAVESTRKSSRNRRNLTNFERQETRNGLAMDIQQEGNADEAATSVEEEEEEQDENVGDHHLEQLEQRNESGTEQTEALVEEEVYGRPEGDHRKTSEGDGEDEALGTSVNQEAELNSSNVAKARGPAEQVKSHVYPEGLAPVIIQSSSKKTLKCPKCDKTFDRIGKYESHTRVHTGEKPFQCDICLQRYSTKSNLTVHKKKHAGDAPVQRKEHKCPFCSKLHASKKTLSKHVKRFHPERIQEFLSMRKRKSEGWKCDICHKSFTRRPHLEEHMILHSQDRPFKCAYCDDYFKSRFARLKHQEKYHLGPFPCDICGRQFNDTGNRKRHIECTHGGKRKWTCYLCGKSVRERTTLREHLRIHSGEKPHLCSICGQSFRHGSSYRLHLRVHHDDKRYECEECGKTFIRHDHLKKHRKIHTGERAHQCEECGKCFRRADHLTVHYKSIHLGEKVWRKYKAVVHQCEVCKKEFRGKTNLMTHFRTHSGEKPHRCVICNQTFRIKKTLTKHMVIHSDVRPFNCPHCSATFKRKDKLKYHVDHVHSGRPASQSPSHMSTASNDKLPGPLASSETAKAYKSVLQGDVCVPVTLVPVQMPEETDLAHAVQQQQQQPPQPGSYQSATDLVFLEKYTLTPQPANIVHPVRPDQMMDPRDQSYLGTLLGLDTATTVQNMAASEHAH
ncbi:zinc finger and BTB domain-containing protein 41 [Pygocentrus nattereri]|uniref:Zinc finger and BTB domain-containing protein 41 n=1 Tax=Pygocentrus nattereri TaxID=42514 RepID=A0AAR2LHD7_PYGNA|nr:zinc finger and BTB domain-containing protein 41 [Pygocentrus nattereri]XP_037400213.1 zinc finger and BTB domain-containing protein 41 [Pygocentrus nattereri]